MTTLSVERQYPIVAIEEVNYDELPSGQAVNVIKLPVNAIVLNAGAFVDAATNAGTSSLLDLGDGDASDLYVSDLDTQVAGESATIDLTEVGKKYPSGGFITATRTETGAPATAGKIRVFASYVVLHRANEVQT